MIRTILAFLSAAALMVALPVVASAHCGTCGVGEAAAEEGAAGCDCAGADGEACACAGAQGEGACDCAGAEAAGDEAAAEDGAPCANCAGDDSAECTCAHGH